ncbi:hypothetical protein BHE74_00022734 [Ensete ventricosum]|nr:hypothetical protein BHE74_00022734 [Ensete ventricosum]
MRPEGGGGGGGTSGATHSSVQSGTHRGPLVGNDGVASTTECHAREAYVTARHGGDALLDVERPPPSQMINKSNTPLPTAESSPLSDPPLRPFPDSHPHPGLASRGYYKCRSGGIYYLTHSSAIW